MERRRHALRGVDPSADCRAGAWQEANSPPDTLRSDIISAVNRSRNNVEADLVLKEGLGLARPTTNQ